jgi:hypothetical protein
VTVTATHTGSTYTITLPSFADGDAFTIVASPA